VTLPAFPSYEKALLALLVAGFAPLGGSDTRIGGDFGFDEDSMDFFIQIQKTPGGSAGQLQGDFVFDVDVFSTDYDLAESVALGLEALLLEYPHVVEVEDRKVVIDDVYQNAGVAPLPWGDDGTYRLGATYVLTARRH
jgi:hypothetical protein